MSKKKIIIFGGGTISHARSHLALCSPAYGSTARQLAALAQELMPTMDVELQLTRMAGGPELETNADIADCVAAKVGDPSVKMIIMSAAMCDFNADVTTWPTPANGSDLKYGDRLDSTKYHSLTLSPADKVIGTIRRDRKDIFLIGFKTTTAQPTQKQYLAGLRLCKQASCNLVLANDVVNRVNMVICPEESRYHETTDRAAALRGLMEMAALRSHLTFTRSTVVAGTPVPWTSELVPASLRAVVDYCIANKAYKSFSGATAGHFAVKLNDTTFLTSIRRTNFNQLDVNGLVRIETDGPDTVLAYGAKPSVGGQSQRIVFRDHPGLDCIVHFHCPIKPDSAVPTVSQREFECGSHQCGQNTSQGLRQFGNLHAVYLENHGPNIVFSRHIDPKEVIDFIAANFDLSQKTGGYAI
jgi:hypothetical protein